MKAPVILFVLVATSSLLCEAGLFRKDKVDPVNLLSDKLSQLSQADDLASNVRLARQHNWQAEPEATQASFMRAVEAFKRLDAVNICGVSNAAAAIRLRRLVGPTNNELLLSGNHKQRRVFRFLDEIRRRVESECFRKMEKEWEADVERNNRFHEKFQALLQLGDLIALYAKPHMFQLSPDVKELNGAIQLLKDPHSKDHQLDSDKVKSALRLAHSIEYKNERMRSLTKAQAEQLIEEHIVKPCKELRKQPEVETFFAPIALLGELAVLDDSVKLSYEDMTKMGKKHPAWGSILWSARNTFCEMFVEQVDRKKLAKKVASSGY